MNYPEWRTEPARRYRVCGECQHHKLIAALHVRHGEGGYREYSCQHPEAWQPMNPENKPGIAKIIRRLETLDMGRHIGKTEKTPDWCPLLHKA